MKAFDNRSLLLCVGFAVICCFPLFHHLDRLSIRLWDESRLAVSALEMTQSGNLVVTTFEDEVDMWNTKPPLMVWLQAVSMKIFGFNELGVRLPAALAGLMTLGFLFLFFLKTLARSDIAVFSTLALVSCAGYVTVHVTRTGDYDALLTLFTTLTVFLTYVWVDSENDSLLAWIGMAVIGMGLTKGIQGFMIMPGLALYLIIKGKLMWVLKQPKFWITALVALVFVIGFYFIRNYFNPGYLSTVWETELGGLYQRSSGFHAQSSRWRAKRFSSSSPRSPPR